MSTTRGKALAGAKAKRKSTNRRGKSSPAVSPSAKGEVDTNRLELWVDDGLTADQERFVNELCADPDRNGTRAAMRAYPKQTYEAAGVTAHENLKKPKILAAIRRRLAPAIVKARTSREAVTRKIGEGMHFDTAEIYNADGTFRPLVEWPREVRDQVTSIEQEELKLTKDGPVVGRIIKVRFARRSEYTTLGARMNKLLTDKLQHEVGGTLEQMLTKVHKGEV